MALSASQTLFTCSDLGVVPVDVIATDPSGNEGFCSSFVSVTDPLDACD